MKRFELVAPLASGSLGETFVAREPGRASIWALLRIRPDLAQNRRFTRVLFAETEGGARLEHRAVAVTRDALREADGLSVATPFISGQTLRTVFKNAQRTGRSLPERWICHLGAELADGLCTAHRIPWFPGAPTPMVHGSVAPGSVWVTYEGRVTLTGLGLGRARWMAPIGPARMPYSAPERFLEGTPTPQTDAYGLGVTLYEVLAGREVFRQPTEAGVRAAVLDARLPALNPRGLDLRPEVVDLIRSLLDRRPENRPGDLQEAAVILRRAADLSEQEVRQGWAHHLGEHFGEARDQMRRWRSGSRVELLEDAGTWVGSSPAWALEGAPGPSGRPAMPTPAEVAPGPGGSDDLGFLGADTFRDVRPVARSAGRYVLEVELPGGGPRKVFRGRDPNLERTVAVHVLDMSQIGDARLEPELWLHMFKLEARLATRLDHPRLPRLLDAGQQENLFYSVYRWFAGVTLAERLEREGPLEADAVIRLGAQWADAMAALHRAGLIHGDLRAVNLMLELDPIGTVNGAVIDLSLAQTSDGPPHPLGRANLLVQAPETLQGASYDARAEQFAFGAVLYQALVGTRPFRGLVDEELRAAILAAEHRSPESMGVESRPRLNEALRRLLARDPSDRFPGFAEVSEFLGGSRRSSEPVLRRTTAALARRLGWSRESASWEAALGLVESPLAAPHPEAAAAAWVAFRYHGLARPPEGRGSLSPRSALSQVRREAEERFVDPVFVRSLADDLRERLSALELSEDADPRILLAGGAPDWQTWLEREGFEVVRVMDGTTVWVELIEGDFVGALLDERLDDFDAREVVRLGKTHPKTRRVRFAVVGEGSFESDSSLCPVLPPSPSAVCALIRGWRT